MKTAIVYYSKHHGNTQKLLDAIAEKHPEVDLFDVTKKLPVDLSQYDRIGFASGIYYSKFHKSLLQFAKDNMPENKQTFLSTSTVQKRKAIPKPYRRRLPNTTRPFGRIRLLRVQHVRSVQAVRRNGERSPERRRDRKRR